MGKTAKYTSLFRLYARSIAAGVAGLAQSGSRRIREIAIVAAEGGRIEKQNYIPAEAKTAFRATLDPGFPYQ
jgi:hypothetical protein